MHITGTPRSTVSMFSFEMYFATVPPPPASTLPSSAVCQSTPCFAKSERMYPTYSADSSLVEYFPPDPVYLDIVIPHAMIALLRFSNTSG